MFLYVSCSGSIICTSVWEERANLSVIVYLYLCGFCSERLPLPLGDWDGLRYLIVPLPGSTINEPRSEKTGLRSFRSGPTQTGLYSHRRWLED